MNNSRRKLFPWVLALTATLLSLLSACSLPQVSAEQRLFLDLSLEFVGAYQLPEMKFKETPVGGLSALAYNKKSNRFYALSDDQSRLAPARFYTLQLTLNNMGIQNVAVENVTFLKTEDGQTYPKGSIDPEGIALSPQNSLFISSEGNALNEIAPFVGEFDLQTGRLRQNLPIPERYISDTTGSKQERGIQNNLGFEALTLNPTGSLPATGEPIRLFTATESALMQDRDPASSESDKVQIGKCRFLHYLLGDGPPLLISEHLYPLSPAPSGAVYHGLSELLAIDSGGHFLSLERSAGLLGFDIQIYQVVTGAASDTSRIASLKGEVKGIQPIRKKLLLNFSDLNLPLDNLEGMTFGPRLPDGTQSLIVVSDNNFQAGQPTQFFLLRLKSGIGDR